MSIMLKARVVTLTREEAARLRAAGLLPVNHATMRDLATEQTLYHVEGARVGDFRVARA